jgi:hypothetical protein
MKSNSHFLCSFQGYLYRADWEGSLGSNKQLQEVEKEIEDGQYVVKPLYVTKFPFPGEEM